jgi:hypothetical protein
MQPLGGTREQPRKDYFSESRKFLLASLVRFFSRFLLSQFFCYSLFFQLLQFHWSTNNVTFAKPSAWWDISYQLTLTSLFFRFRGCLLLCTQKKHISYFNLRDTHAIRENYRLQSPLLFSSFSQ